MQWTGSSFPLEWGSPGNCHSIEDLQENVPASCSSKRCPVLDSPSPEFHPSMREDHQARGRLRFGVFELDLRAGELRKHGLQVRLQEQPFQVLVMLLGRSEERRVGKECRSRWSP